MSKPRRQCRQVSGILLLDKPAGLSSNQALQQVKRHYRAEKAGHTGSLDPMATGVLPICLGEATKLSAVLLESDKSYLATLRLGQRTDTGDIEGRVVETRDVAVSRDRIEAVLADFVGVIDQVPPMYSALKHQGQPLYALARQGVEVERSARRVTITELRLIEFAPPELTVQVRCSKGTYIRTLAEDIAAAAGQCAHLIALRRIAVDPFGSLEQVSMATIEGAAAEGEAALDALLLSPARGLAHWPQLQLDAVRAERLARGQAVVVPGAPRGARIAVLNHTGELLGLAETREDGTVMPRRWLRPAAPRTEQLPAQSGL